jgi:hypothetical protein
VSGRPPRLRVVLELADAGGPGDAPALVRLRGALKSLLRRRGWRCERCTEAASPGMPDETKPFEGEEVAGGGRR